jgi:hypothetical protein
MPAIKVTFSSKPIQNPLESDHITSGRLMQKASQKFKTIKMPNDNLTELRTSLRNERPNSMVA